MGLSACQAKEGEIITVGVVNFVEGLEPVLEGFKKGMTELCNSEGENITYLYNGQASNQDELKQIATDL